MGLPCVQVLLGSSTDEPDGDSFPIRFTPRNDSASWSEERRSQSLRGNGVPTTWGFPAPPACFPASCWLSEGCSLEPPLRTSGRFLLAAAHFVNRFSDLKITSLAWL